MSGRDELDSDRGPLDIDDLPNNEGTELCSVLLNPVKFKLQQQKKNHKRCNIAAR